MKLNFKDSNLNKFSFRDLEYGLKVLQEKLDSANDRLEEIKSDEYFSNYAAHRHHVKVCKPLEDKIKLVENELSERLLTGNDGGAFEQLFLGSKNV